MVKDGYKFAAAPLLFGFAALGIHWFILGALLLLLGAFVLYFFRDPERFPPPDPDAIVSPADGRVMVVVEEARGAIPGRRISIFLSIFDDGQRRPMKKVSGREKVLFFSNFNFISRSKYFR